jgi:hypothetical protein
MGMELLMASMLFGATDAASVPFYLELDGAYYSVPVSATVEYIGDAWVVTQTSATACDRRNGQVQQFSNFALFYGANLDVVYLTGSSYYCIGTAADEACVLALTSTTGDIVCGGAIAPPDPIFANGFDGP